jgi:hyaluronoglucosaminidase
MPVNLASSRPAPRSRGTYLATALCAAAVAALVLAVAQGCGDADVAASGAFRHRGVIEGFYGRPYTTAERVRLVRLIGARGMNAYVYAPKSDPKHRDEWRAPYTAEELAGFAELADAGEAAGVRIYFAISPGITYRAGDPDDFRRLAEKLASVHAAGVRGFALLFDDIFDANADALQRPSFQAELTARVAELVAGYGDGSDLWFIGHLYGGRAEQFVDATIDPRIFLYPHPPAAYYDAYAAIVPPEIPILWTGPDVISRTLRRDEARAFRDFARRPVIVWDNFPANDIFGSDLFMGPYLGRDRDLDRAVDGIVLNVMTQPAATLVAVATGADYLRDPRGYDPEASWRAAIADVGGADAEVLGRFVALHRGHPFLEGAIEAPELGARIAAAFGASAGEGDRAALRGMLEDIALLEADVAAMRDLALATDVAPWAAKATMLARASLAGLDAVAGAGSEGNYRALRAEAERRPQLVARDTVAPAVEAITGPGNEVDRFGDLFAAIDAELR